MWPVDGYDRPLRRELLPFVLDYRNAAMTRIRPGVSAEATRAEAKQASEAGYENFTAFLPTELDALEALAREKGLVQALPAPGEAGFERLARPAGR
jgi:hypothetical protein